MPRLPAALAASLLLAAPALAGNVDDIRVALPETVELAELQPGLQVVTRLDIEVFTLDGAYWLQNGGRWYSSRRPQEGFQAVEARAVPPALARLVRGAHLDYRPAPGQRVTRLQVGVEPLPTPARPAAAGPKAPARTPPAAKAPPAKPPPAKATPTKPPPAKAAPGKARAGKAKPAAPAGAATQPKPAGGK